MPHAESKSAILLLVGVFIPGRGVMNTLESGVVHSVTPSIDTSLDLCSLDRLAASAIAYTTGRDMNPGFAGDISVID
jgi:hypothetical protein